MTRLGAFDIWQKSARVLLARGVSPEQISWTDSTVQAALFAESETPEQDHVEGMKVTREFLETARKVVAHKNSDRFDRLYRVLWRLQNEPQILDNPADPDVHHLHAMAKSINRDCHKMKAFVRFCELAGSFFARRFADMDWVISTPFGIAQFNDGELFYHEADGDRHAAADQTEELWRTYFSNIFNPARLKVKAMQSEMPKKYWKNLPEAALIPDLIAGAEKRVQAMRERMPTLVPGNLEKIKAPHVEHPVFEHEEYSSIADLRHAATHCQRCQLHCFATQTIFGEGKDSAEIMFVGEQPGDQEDIAARTFVGPAGQIFTDALGAANCNQGMMLHARTTMDYRNKCGNDTVSGVKHHALVVVVLARRPKTFPGLNPSKTQNE